MTTCLNTHVEFTNHMIKYELILLVTCVSAQNCISYFGRYLKSEQWADLWLISRFVSMIDHFKTICECFVVATYKIAKRLFLPSFKSIA